MPALEPVEITAGALHLRPWRATDADAVLAICQDPAIQRWTAIPSPYSRSDAVTFVERIAQVGWPTGTAAHLAVVDATSAELLASVSLQNMCDDAGIPGFGPDGTAEIGYWCAPAARGRGIATGAVSAVCRWGFGALGLASVRWRAVVGNEASRTVARRAGFTLDPSPRPLVNPRDGKITDFWTGTLRP
jgi:RimJ/RimL family protein N-acetyltransferase